MGRYKLLLVWGIIVLASFTSLLQVNAATLNKTAIIPQSETAYNGITADDINTYFRRVGSQLADYVIPRDFEVYYPVAKGQWDKITITQEWQSNDGLEVYHGKTVAQLLYEWSFTSRPNRAVSSTSPGQINPLISIATLDKESGSVNGAYKSDILTAHPATLSWIMGYGFDGSMANCWNYGDCNIDANRQKAMWYGGPGQQIAEGVSALKRWSTNPTPLNSCSTGEWFYMQINGECLRLENGISYALYRYTPNFSGQQLFINVYDNLKNTFTYTPPPPPDHTGEDNNDTADAVIDTYSESVTLTGTKSAQNRVNVGSDLVADLTTTSWTYTFRPAIGSGEYGVEYKRSTGVLITRKKVVINRHKMGDINGDSKVDILDLSELAQYWGQTNPRNPMVKLTGNQDEEVNILDLSILASNWTD